MRPSGDRSFRRPTTSPMDRMAHLSCAGDAANLRHYASAHATMLRTNNGSSCRWLRMIPSLGTKTTRLCARLRFYAIALRERSAKDRFVLVTSSALGRPTAKSSDDKKPLLSRNHAPRFYASNYFLMRFYAREGSGRARPRRPRNALQFLGESSATIFC